MKTGYIYRLWTPGITDEYIGSTTDMRKAKYQHKAICNNVNHKRYNLKLYKFIRANGGWDNWRMDMIEQIEFEDRMELRKRDGEIIQNRGATLNFHKAYGTRKEYKEANKEKIKVQRREYREKNKEAIKEKREQYKRDNREKINDRKNAKFECLCGDIIKMSGKYNHLKTIRHIKNFENGLYEYINS